MWFVKSPGALCSCAFSAGAMFFCWLTKKHSIAQEFDFCSQLCKLFLKKLPSSVAAQAILENIPNNICLRAAVLLLPPRKQDKIEKFVTESSQVNVTKGHKKDVNWSVCLKH